MSSHFEVFHAGPGVKHCQDVYCKATLPLLVCTGNPYTCAGTATGWLFAQAARVWWRVLADFVSSPSCRKTSMACVEAATAYLAAALQSLVDARLLTWVPASLHQIAGWVSSWQEPCCWHRATIGRAPELAGQACSPCTSRKMNQKLARQILPLGGPQVTHQAMFVTELQVYASTTAAGQQPTQLAQEHNN